MGCTATCQTEKFEAEVGETQETEASDKGLSELDSGRSTPPLPALPRVIREGKLFLVSGRMRCVEVWAQLTSEVLSFQSQTVQVVLPLAQVTCVNK